MIKISALAAVLASVLLHSAAVAQQPPLRIGLVYSFSGPFALAGAQVDAAINLFMKRHGDVVAGRKVEIIRRDTTGPAPDVARRLAGELVTRKVDILTGIDFRRTRLRSRRFPLKLKFGLQHECRFQRLPAEGAPWRARFPLACRNRRCRWRPAAGNGIKSVYSPVADHSRAGWREGVPGRIQARRPDRDRCGSRSTIRISGHICSDQGSQAGRCFRVPAIRWRRLPVLF
jgi:branched-chain amino acid transport system substrate-binding protein